MKRCWKSLVTIEMQIKTTTRYHLILFSINKCVSRSVVPNSLRPHGLQPTRLLCPWDFPGKDTGVGCHFLLQGIFPTQGSNPGLLHCRQILYRLSYKSVCPSSKNLQTINAGESVERREHAYIVDGNLSWYSHWKTVWRFLKKKKKLKIELMYESAILLLGIYPE